MNSNVKNLLGNIFSEQKENELSKVVDPKVKNGVMCSSLREYYVGAVRASEQLQENATWANAYLVSAIVSSDNFTKAFKDRTDLADTIGYSKSTISKLLSVVELKDVLFEKGYVEQYTVGQLSELVPSYNDAKKKELSIIPMLEHMGFNASMTSKDVREGIKSYKNSLVTVVDTPVTSSVSAVENKPVDTPVTSSVSAVENKPVDTLATSSVSAVENNSVDDEVSSTKPETGITSPELHEALKRACDATTSIEISIKPNKKKKHVIKVDSDKFYDLFVDMISLGLMTLEKEGE